MEKITNKKEILSKALAIIVETRAIFKASGTWKQKSDGDAWDAKGNPIDWRTGNAVSYHPIAALRYASLKLFGIKEYAWANPESFNGPYGFANRAMYQALFETFGYQSLFDWNDEPGRNRTDVVRLLSRTQENLIDQLKDLQGETL